MPHTPVQKLLFYCVNFIKRTSYHHKKKLIALVVIALLSYIAKKKLRLVHLIHAAQKIMKIISYLPLPTFPEYRKLNRYQPVIQNNKQFVNEIINSIKLQEIRSLIKQKKSDWNELKNSIFSGCILSLVLYNIQTFYFVLQNKYQSDFIELRANQVFQKMMGDIRKTFLNEIPKIKEILSNYLLNQLGKIDVKATYTLDEYFLFVDNLVDEVFNRKFIIKKQQNQLIKNSIYREEKHFQMAENYFLTSLEYIPQNESKFNKIKNKISKILNKFSFTLFKQPKLQLTQQRFQWTNIAYKLPLKKSLNQYQWPNKQSQLLSKMIISQMDQVIGSINFSTLVYESAKMNLKILKNRLFLYFSKSNITSLRCAEALSVLYKLIKEQILITQVHSVHSLGQDKRQKFYDAQILKAIKQKNLHDLKKRQQIQQKSNLLLIQQQKTVQQVKIEQSKSFNQHLNAQVKRQSEQINQQTSPQVILLNMHLQQILQAKQFGFLVKEFQIKYFNQRSKITINPMPIKTNGSVIKDSQGDDIQKLLSLLGDNQELNKKD